MKHNIVELRDRFKRLLDTLCNEYNFGGYVDGRSPEDIECSWEEYNEASNALGIWTGSGATKLVIGDDNCDYVIKFGPWIDEFDYCEREVEVYEEAENRGFADKFAWTDFLFDYNFNESMRLPVYVMEWCQCSYDMIDDEMDDWHYTRFCSSTGITKGDDDAYEKYCDSRDNCDVTYSERMMEWAYSVWGLDYNISVDPETDTIARFMRRMFINDIHAGNWGWCNNRLVLVDYSGYGEDYNERSINY